MKYYRIVTSFFLLIFIILLYLFLYQDDPHRWYATDEFLLYSLSILTLMMCLFILALFRRSGAYVNLASFGVYTLLLYAGLYTSTGGGGLVYWFYILLVTAIHFVVMLAYSMVKVWKRSGTQLHEL